MKETIRYYFLNNLKQYIVVSIVFLIGIILGVIAINNTNEDHTDEIKNYINTSVSNIKEDNIKNKNMIFFEKIRQKVVIIILCGVLGSTVIGLPLLYIFIGYRGFSLGYTISAIIASLETKNALLFSFSGLFAQNIFYILALFVVTVSGTNFCRYLLRNESREQIKFEIIKHIVFITISLVIIIVSAFSESYISLNLLKKLKNYL